MNDPSPLRAAAIERAAGAIEAAKLRVLDREWRSGDHQLDLVATPGQDILAAVEVRATAHGTPGACVTALTEARFLRATEAARAWMHERGATYGDLWVVLVTVDPESGTGLVAGVAPGVA